MSNIFDNLSDKLQHLSNKVAKDGKKYLKTAVSKGEEIGHKGKIQIEIEKLKWELKQNYNKLGKYVSEKKITKSVTDFSHDNDFLNIVNEINKLKLFVEEREKEKVKGNQIK
ncbi:MAG: hypothetical protein H8E85_00965 [Candidatus Marinimicrobia bacterium]|nr:hypothetical protein [Candidatus Neomarinimicrobiota bacterium]